MKNNYFKVFSSFLLIFVMVLGLVLNTGVIHAEDKYQIILAHSVPESHAYHQGYLKFKELVEERTDGKVTVKIFPNNTLGGDLAATDSVRMGNIQMALTGTFALYQLNPHWGVFDMPFLFQDYDEVDRIVEGEIGKQLLQEDVGNVIPMGFMENGFRYLANSKRPVRKPSDLNGLKIRIMESPIYVDSWKAIGASPNPMAFGEVYTALDTGVVDGVENPPSLLYAMGFQEVQKYLTTTRHLYLAGITIMNKKFFNSLPSDIQEIIKDSFQEAAKYQRGLVREEDVKAMEKLEKELEVTYLSPEERQVFAEMSYPVYKKYADKIGKDFVIRVLEELNRDELIDYLN